MRRMDMRSREQYLKALLGRYLRARKMGKSARLAHLDHKLLEAKEAQPRHGSVDIPEGFQNFQHLVIHFYFHPLLDKLGQSVFGFF